MDSYHSRQAIMPHFHGHARQRGSGFGSIALGVGRVPLPFAKKVLPVVQSIGKVICPKFTRNNGSCYKEIFQTSSKSCTDKDGQKANRRGWK